MNDDEQEYDIHWKRLNDSVELRIGAVKSEYLIDEAWTDTDQREAIDLRCLNIRHSLSTVILLVGPSGTGKAFTLIGDQRSEGMINRILKKIRCENENEVIKIECHEILESRLSKIVC